MIDQAGTTIKSSVTYAYVRNRQAPTDSHQAPSGYKTMFRAELAGLGGDVSFTKLGATHSHAWSLGRYAPDTGYQLPISKSAFLARQAALLTSTNSSSDYCPPAEYGPSGRRLAAHPLNSRLLPADYPAPSSSVSSSMSGGDGASSEGSAAASNLDPRVAASSFLSIVSSPEAGDGHGLLRHAGDVMAAAAAATATPAASSSSASQASAAAPPAAAAAAASYTLADRLAAWVSPGITLAIEGGVGALLPLGADSSRPGGSRIVDRFFLTSAKLRGFDSVGPKAAPVPEGTLHGDLLGGDYQAYASARLLLPPPFPSVRMANAGLRSQLWATAASIKSASEVSKPEDLLTIPSLAAGVGVVSVRSHSHVVAVEVAADEKESTMSIDCHCLDALPFSAAGHAAHGRRGAGGQLRPVPQGQRDRPGGHLPHAAAHVRPLSAAGVVSAVDHGGRDACDLHAAVGGARALLQCWLGNARMREL